MSLTTLKDQRIVILGGSSGMGYAVGEAAIADGANVTIASSSKAKVDSAVAQLGKGAQGFAVDVTDEASVSAFFSDIGAFDHLVFTAGDDGLGYQPGPVESLNLSEAGQALKVRFWGALAAIKHAKQHLSGNGSITLTDGVLSLMPMKGMFLASAFGGAIEHLIRGLAIDLAPIRVNSVCPGLILTERVAPWGDEMIGKITESLPLARVGSAHEAAQAYLYLMRGGYTTGQVIVVDGGRSLL